MKVSGLAALGTQLSASQPPDAALPERPARAILRPASAPWRQTTPTHALARSLEQPAAASRPPAPVTAPRRCIAKRRDGRAVMSTAVVAGVVSASSLGGQRPACAQAVAGVVPPPRCEGRRRQQQSAASRPKPRRAARGAGGASRLRAPWRRPAVLARLPVLAAVQIWGDLAGLPMPRALPNQPPKAASRRAVADARSSSFRAGRRALNLPLPSLTPSTPPAPASAATNNHSSHSSRLPHACALCGPRPRPQ